MEFNKRTFLWLVFSFSLLLLWNEWMISKGGQSLFSTAPAPVATAPATGAAGTAALPDAPVAAGTPVVPGAAPVAQPAQAETITVTTDVVKANISTMGGVITRLELLNFRDGQDDKQNQVLFDHAGTKTYLGQTGLVGQGAAGAMPNHTTPFVAQPGVRTLDGGNAVQVVLVAEQGGVKLTKTYTFKKGDYVIDVRHDVTNLGAAPVQPSVYYQITHDGNEPPGSSWMMPIYTGPTLYTAEDHYQKLTFAEIEDGSVEHSTKADNGWIALSQHFFVSAFIPQDKAQRDIYTKKLGNNLYAIGSVVPMGAVAPGATASSSARLYSGPQDEKNLETIAPGLELVKDYGMFTVFAKPIFWVLDKIQNFIGNWGWTIVVFTVLIKLLFFPLSAASYRSMAKIKLVAPKLQALKERHKDDPLKMNQATMELYRSEKINPLGGCLPMLVQMPVFIALFYVLQASVEMRGAPWVLWITDLTKPDPYYILPVIYAVSMWVNMKLSPQPADPMQAKMMMWMPLIFSVMFFFFPSGLVLYWVVNNLISMAQQWVITKKIIGDPK